jgi:hypothetical protein
MKRMLMGLGALVLSVSVVELAAPKVVRAAVAALVQVANTVSAPAITQGVPYLASQQVTLFCNLSPDPASRVCSLLGPGETWDGTEYTVPSTQKLVITDVEVVAPVGSTSLYFSIEPVSSGLSEQWTVPADGLTHEFQFLNGIVWPGGYPIRPTGNIGVTAYMRGYLTAN